MKDKNVIIDLTGFGDDDAPSSGPLGSSSLAKAADVLLSNVIEVPTEKEISGMIGAVKKALSDPILLLTTAGAAKSTFGSLSAESIAPFLAVAFHESGFDPIVKNASSSATSYLQMIKAMQADNYKYYTKNKATWDAFFAPYIAFLKSSAPLDAAQWQKLGMVEKIDPQNPVFSIPQNIITWKRTSDMNAKYAFMDDKGWHPTAYPDNPNYLKLWDKYPWILKDPLAGYAFLMHLLNGNGLYYPTVDMPIQFVPEALKTAGRVSSLITNYEDILNLFIKKIPL